MRSFPVLCSATMAAVLAACSTDVTNQGSSPNCSTTIEATYPVDGSSNFYYRDAIEFYLSSPDPSARVMTDIEGEQYTPKMEKRFSLSPAKPWSR